MLCTLFMYNTVPFCQVPLLSFSDKLQTKLLQLNWQDLAVTTGLSKKIIFKMILQGYATNKWSIWDFLKHYGFLLKKIPTLLNFKLPANVENEIQDQVIPYFSEARLPIIRLQVMYNGCFLPIHTDITRNASLVIPLLNHSGSWTKFYRYHGNSTQLINPGDCHCFSQVEITKPTLIDTTVPHSVVTNYCPPISAPRISVTVKWVDVKYQSLLESML